VAGVDAAHEVLRELGGIVLAHEPRDTILERVAALAKRAIDPAEEVSLTLIEEGRAYTAAHTGALALDADELQYERGHGPCMDAGRAGLTMVISDMLTEERWPDYTRAAAERGVGSSLSVPLPVQGSSIGAINIYSTKRRAFEDPDVVAVGEEIAGLAAVAVHNATTYASAASAAEQMAEAMASRAVIEQAKGVVMALHGCDADQAFALLTKESQRRNHKLREIAREVVERAARSRS
jgi:GAF domain-containing protein